MTIRLLGLNCSPRDRSNSRATLDESFDYVNAKFKDEVQTEILDLRNLRIEHCLACNVCGKTKDTGEFIDCAIKDDDMAMVREKMVAADGFLVATPVYFGLPSDLFSKFIMRTRLLRHQDFALANKVAAVIAIAGRRSGGSETTIISCWLPLIRNGCLIVGNGDKTCQFGTMAWAGGRQEVLKDEWGLEQARDTAERVFQIARLVKAGATALNYANGMRFSYTSGMKH